MRPAWHKRLTLTALLALFIACLLAGRIWYVNAHAQTIPSNTAKLGDSVPLEGAFAEYAYENTGGYLVKATKAERMSINEYIDLYSTDQSVLTDYLSNEHYTTDRDLKTLIVVDLEIRNNKTADDDRGYLNSIGWSVKSAAAPEIWIRTESTLLESSIPQAEGAFQLSIKPGTTSTVHVPFSGIMRHSPFPASDYDASFPELVHGQYSLVLTKGKVKNVLDLGAI